MKKTISLLILLIMLISAFHCNAETKPISGGDPARTYTFEELTNLSREDIDHLVIRSGNDGIRYSTAYDTIITDVYTAINTKSFLPTAKEGTGDGWSYEVIFFDKNNQSFVYNTTSGIVPKENKYGGLAYMTNNAEELQTVVENAYNLIANDCSDWACDYIAKAKNIGLLQDITDISYKDNISREKFCEIVYNLIDMTTDIVWKKVSPNPFQDTDNEKVIALRLEDIIFGKGEQQFAPNDFLTREEAATIIVRMINMVMPMPATEMYFEYDDNDEISEWASHSIQTISNLGFMNGVEENKFAPKDTYTTEQAIVTVMRVYDAQLNNMNEQIVKEDLSFSDKLNAQMPSDKNYMFSPLSVKMALALAANGAAGETKNEILNALGISDLEDFNVFSKDLIKRYSQTDILSLNIANSIWMNKDKTSQNFSDEFANAAKVYYNAEVMATTNQDAVNEINSWVKDKTNSKIPQIIQRADDFWAMLINAIYFKGAWEDEFIESYTKSDEFTNADGTKTQTDFMNKTDWFSYAKTNSVQIIELPYKNRIDKFSDDGEYLGTEKYDDLDVSMYLVAANGDISVEQELNHVITDEKMETAYIDLSMPKFKIEFETALNDILKNIGITQAFNENTADFTKMFDIGNMWITKTIHKTYICVDEKGTEAAAVTAVGMGGSAMPPEPIELKFNKPFYFVIRDNKSGETLFMGRYSYAK